MRELFWVIKMFLKKIKDLREEQDLTQIKMAKIINVSKSTYGRWETDEAIIPLIHLNKLCNYFKVSMDYMVGLTDQKNYDNINTVLNKELIAKRLKEFRKDKNLSQVALAKKLGTTHSTISGYENGKTGILTIFAYVIAKEYDISLDWLCGRKNNSSR